MTKERPRNRLLVVSLRSKSAEVHERIYINPKATHATYLLQVAVGKGSWYLDREHSALVRALEDVRKAAVVSPAVERGIRKLELHCCGGQIVEPTNIAQIFYAEPLGPWEGG